MHWTALLETTTPKQTPCCPWPAYCSCSPAPPRRPRPVVTRSVATVRSPWEAPLGIDLGSSGDAWEEVRRLLERGQLTAR